MSPIELKIECIRRGIQQGVVGERLGVDKVTLSRYLNEVRPMPEGFTERFLAALEEIAREMAGEAAAAAEAEAQRRIARLMGEPSPTERETAKA
jgi:hypothetical protein